MGREMKNKLRLTRHVNFSTKIILINILSIILIFSIAGSLLYSNLYQYMYSTEQTIGNEALVKLNDFCRTKNNSVFGQYTMIHSLNSIGDIFTNISNRKVNPYDNDNIQIINNFLGSYLAADPDIAEYILVTDGGIVFSSGSSSGRWVSPSFDFANYPMIEKLRQSEENILVDYDATTPYANIRNLPVVSYAGKIYNTQMLPQKQIVGYFIINIPSDAYSESLASLHSEIRGDLIFCNSDHTILFSTNKELQGTKYRGQNHAGLTEYSKMVDVSGSTTIMLFDDTSFFSAIADIKYYLMSVFTIGVALVMFATYVLHRAFKRKLNMLAKSMKSVRTGDLSKRLPTDETDEIGKLSVNFNDMCDQLQRFIELNYEAETQKRLAEINALQAQINPHFLYNTIDCIRDNALHNSDPDVANMLVTLANLFRYSANFNENIVFLEDEIDYVKSYLELQKMRFRGKFDYTVDIPARLLYNGIPKLVLQPLIENAILHGLRDSQNGHIDIRAHEQDSNLVIEISDNGCGMTKEAVKSINQFLQSPQYSVESIYGIGVKNVHDRIRLLFNGDSGIHISSKLHEGTVVRIVLPSLRKEEMIKCIK